MSDWNAGYRVDIDYTHGYYAQLNPLHMRFALLLAGIRPPRVQTACELGYGHGVSLNIHAASSGVTWFGTDFNPAHTAFANELGQASGAAVHCYNDAFVDFADRADLPEFDFIALHGIWSWVSVENQRAILRLIERKLRVGGVVYIGYNTMPGWAPVLPLRELLVQHFETATNKGSAIEKRIAETVQAVTDLFKTNPAALRANPALAERLAGLGPHDPRYLAHEYFGAHWTPQSIAEMARDLGGVRLRYACSARFLDMVDAINLTPAQATILQRTEDPMMRELLRDFMVNQFFRRDYWVKGAQGLSQVERARNLREMRVMLLQSPEKIDLKVRGVLGEADLLPAIYEPILQALGDRTPVEIGHVEAAVATQGVGFALVLEALAILIGRGLVMPLQPETEAESALRTTAALNGCLMERAETSGDVSVLASPLTGGGVSVGRIQQVFLGECLAGRGDVASLVTRAWSVLSAQGQVMLKDGQPIAGEAENCKELETLARTFLDHERPLLATLQIG